MIILHWFFIGIMLLFVVAIMVDLVSYERHYLNKLNDKNEYTKGENGTSKD